MWTAPWFCVCRHGGGGTGVLGSTLPAYRVELADDVHRASRKTVAHQAAERTGEAAAYDPPDEDDRPAYFTSRNPWRHRRAGSNSNPLIQRLFRAVKECGSVGVLRTRAVCRHPKLCVSERFDTTAVPSRGSRGDPRLGRGSMRPSRGGAAETARSHPPVMTSLIGPCDGHGRAGIGQPRRRYRITRDLDQDQSLRV
jgi:hypothetical protein